MVKKLFIFIFCLASTLTFGQRHMEYLNRGLIAMRTGPKSVFLSWRLLGNENRNTSFQLFRKTNNGKEQQIANITGNAGTNFTDTLADLTVSNTWIVKPVKEKDNSGGSFTIPANAATQNYLNINLQTPEGYSPGDASPGDMDGDGTYELVIHMTGRGRDNGSPGFTTPPIFQAYKLDGTLLWTINLGKNIREGAHYTQFLVYDFDGDGKAEVVMKTADGTIDGVGNVIGDSTADHRNAAGHIYKGPEFLTVFDGLTGKALATTNYIPLRYPDKTDPTPGEMKALWGDDHYNRSERYLACVAYLDGKLPSIVMCRGYYTRTVLAAWNWRNGSLNHVWTFDSNDGNPDNLKYRGQGNHNLSVGDVDNDGCDEIMYGSCAIDNTGKGLYSTGIGHADAMHFSDLDPDKPGLEVFNIQERFDDAGMNFRNAATGEIYWKVAAVKADEEGGDKGEGPGRGLAENIDPRYRGSECWAFGAGMVGLYNAKGEKISDTMPRSCNFAIWWDGDLQREILDRNYIAKWNWQNLTLENLLVATDCMSNNGTKANPVLSADLFGDWREEVIFRTRDNKSIRIYSTTIPTTHRLTTLMHDPIYRLGIAWQNVGYNQPPHTGFYMGDDMDEPPMPNIQILTPKPLTKSKK